MEKEKEIFFKILKKEKIKKRIIDAFTRVERRDFFDEFFSDRIYDMNPIPVGYGEESEDPLILAKMIQILSPLKKWKILEVGTGSGYSTAILSSMVSEVVTVEYHENLAAAAKKRFIKMGLTNIRSYAGDATDFNDPIGEFDGIIIFAACINRPFTLMNILKEGGTLVYPMGPPFKQQITLYKEPPVDKPENSMKDFKFFDFCNFNSIIGKLGWLNQSEAFPEEPSSDL